MAAAAPPVLFFSDLTWGPKSGWEGSSTRGAAVSVWGKNLGASRGGSYVTVGNTQLTSASDYAEWGAPGPARGLERITFWLNSSIDDSAATIGVTVNGIASNLLPFTIANGTIYFISVADGDNANDGLRSTAAGSGRGPFRDLCKFNPGLDGSTRCHNPSGDGQYVAYVKAGTYTAQDVESAMVALRGPYGGPTKQKALVAYPGENPIIDTAGATRGIIWTADYDPYGFDDYFTFSKLSGVNGTAPIGIFGSYNRVIGCTFSDYLADAWTGVVWVGDSKHASIFGNLFDHNGYDSYKHNIYIKTQPSISSGDLSTEYIDVGWNEFRNAVASDTHGGVIFISKSSDSTVAAFPTRYVYIHDNDFHDGNMDFVYVGDGITIGDVYLYNNLFRGGSSSNGGLTFQQGTGTVYLFNNLFYRTAGISSSKALMWATGAAQLHFKNNIWYADAGEDFIELETYQGATVESDHDLFFHSTGTTAPPSGAGIQVSNPVVADPLFVADGTDFHLQAASHAVHSGTSAVSGVVVSDYDGAARPLAGYDIGAYQFVVSCAVAADCTTPSVCHQAAGATCSAGSCTYPPAPVGTSCDDGNACTSPDTCDGLGACTRGPDLCGGGGGGGGAGSGARGGCSSGSAPSDGFTILGLAWAMWRRPRAARSPPPRGRRSALRDAGTPGALSSSRRAALPLNRLEGRHDATTDGPVIRALALATPGAMMDPVVGLKCAAKP